MTRDYARTNRPRPQHRNSRVAPTRKSIPGWLWLIAGILIGALVTGIIDLRNSGDSSDSQSAIDTQAEDVDSTVESSPDHKPRFDFYTLLKETEVIVPDENGNLPTKAVVIPEAKEIEQPAKPEGKSQPTQPASATQPSVTAKTPLTQPTAAEKPEATTQQPATAAPSTTPRVVYMLQAGSFRSPADADSVRARLLLLNMQARVEQVTTSANQTWHRVIIGPFSSQEDANRASAQLRQNGIDSIQLKRKL